jgi:hypothetical protein
MDVDALPNQPVADAGQCPLWVKSGHSVLYPRKQTFAVH